MATDPSPSAKLTSYRQTHALLTLAAHRNKNQHGHARWWSALGMLRRAVGRLVGEMEALEGVTEDGRKLKGREKREVLARVEARKAWMRGVLVGRCWLAFSGVIADNQYSALGLMLLGTLARVNRLLGPAPDAESEPEAGKVQQAKDEKANKNETEESTVQGVEAEGLGIGMDVDLGEKVERGEAGVDAEVEAAAAEPEVEISRMLEEKPTRKEEAVEKRILTVDGEGEATASESPKKKKKKKKKGDAIDALFAGLL